MNELSNVRKLIYKEVRLGLIMIALPERDKYKILLIEDNLIDRKLIHEFMEQTKSTEFELKDTDRLSSGLQLLAEETFDAVLLDLFLPDAGKLEALDKIIDFKTDLPIIILTGLGDEDLGISAVRRGAQDYLVKGDFERSLLIRSIIYAIERKRAEIALVESETKYRMLFESSGEGRMISDSTGMILDANPTAAAILGYKSPDELKKIRMTDLYMYPEQRKEIFENLATRGSIDKTEMIGKKKDGMPFYTLATMLAHKDEEGEILQVDGIFRDITAQKQAEEALQQRTYDLEERVKEINCLYGVSQLTTDPSRPLDEILQQVLQLIPHAWRFPNITQAKIEFKGTIFRTKNFKKTPWLQTADITMSGKRMGNIEVCYLEEAPVSFEGPFLKEERDLIDTLAREIGIFAERTKVDEELHESEARYRQLVESIGEIIFTLTSEGIISSLNPAFERITGWNREEFINTPFLRLLHPDDLSVLLERFEAYPQALQPDTFEVQIKTKDGHSLVVEGTVTPQYENEILIGFYGIAHDITERKQAEEALRKSEARLRIFMDSSAVSFSLWDSELNLIDHNINSLEMFHPPGTKNEDVIGMSMVELSSDLKKTGRYKTYLEVIKSGTPFRNDNLVIHRMNDDIHLSLEVFKVESGLGVIATDVTNQKLAENEIKKATARLEYILASNPAIIYTAKPDGEHQTTFMSDNVKRITGYEPQNFVGNPNFWVDRLHPEDRKQVKDFYKRNIAETGYFGDFYRFRHKNGNYRWMVEEAKLITDDQGAPIEIIGFWSDITEQKEIEEAFQKSEEKYRDLIENLSDIVVETDSEAKMTFVSPQVSDVLGYTPGEITGKNSLDYVHPDDLESVVEALAKKEGLSFEYSLKHKDGHYVPFSVRGRVIREDSAFKLVGVFRDISVRKKAEEKIRENEEKYRNIIENLSDTVVEMDVEGNFTYISPQGVNLLGMKPEDVIGKNGFQFIHPDDIETINDVLKKVLEGESVFNYECRGKHKDGNYIWLSISSRAVEVTDSVKIVSIIQDITERKQIEFALRESEERFRQLVETSPDGIVLTDLLGDILLINKQGASILGYKDVHDLITINIFELIATEDQQLALRTIKETLKTGEGIKLEYNFLKKDGTRIPIEMNTTIIKDTIESKRYFMATIRDITENKEAIRLLQESEKKFRTILETIEDGYYEVDLAGNFSFFNDQLCNLLRYSRNELQGTSYKQFGDEPSAQRVYQTFNTVYRTGNPAKGFEWEIMQKIGSKKTIDASVSLITDSSGATIGFRGIARDITKRKQLEESLRVSEEKYRILFESAPIAIGMSDVEGNALAINQQMVDLMGYTVDELKSVNLSDTYVDPDDRWKAIAILQDVGRIEDWEVKRKRKDGTTYIASMNTEQMEFEGQQILLTTSFDVTEQKQAQEMIKRSEEHFRQIFKKAPIGMVLADLDYTFLRTNIVFCQILGYTEQELAKLTFKDVTHPDHIKRDVEHSKKLAKKEIDLYKAEQRYIKKNKEILWARTTVTLLFDEKDEPHCYLAMIEDISHQKQAEEEIRKQLMKFKIEDGNIYLISESSPTLSKQVFSDLIKVGYSGLAISRMPEKEFKREIDAEFQFLWFSETEKRNSFPPQLKEVEKMIDGMQVKSVIWIDRLDYLVLKNSFKETLKSVFRWREIAYLNNVVVILSVDPTTLPKQQIHSLEKETKVVEPRFLFRVPDDSLEVLRFIYQQNNLGVKPSYTDIGNELEISKPTTRKRLKHLVATGYLNEQKSGNRKILELTEKGLMLFRK